MFVNFLTKLNTSHSYYFLDMKKEKNEKRKKFVSSKSELWYSFSPTSYLEMYPFYIYRENHALTSWSLTQNVLFALDCLAYMQFIHRIILDQTNRNKQTLKLWSKGVRKSICYRIMTHWQRSMPCKILKPHKPESLLLW